MSFTTLANTLKQFLIHRRFMVLLGKVCHRVLNNRGRFTVQQNRLWIKEHCVDYDSFARKIHESLWEETQHVFIPSLHKAKLKLESVHPTLGGAGLCPILYFLTRLRTPLTVIETGVAAGFSSMAFLMALRQNGKGQLYSSDFPYFRLENPEKLIGLVVEEDLKDKWHLFIEGDHFNLKNILSKVQSVDFFHYDSDKRYQGKRRAFKLLSPYFHDDTIVMIDDIQDDSFFYEYTLAHPNLPFYIFEYEGKFIGLSGRL